MAGDFEFVLLTGFGRTIGRGPWSNCCSILYSSKSRL